MRFRVLLWCLLFIPTLGFTQEGEGSVPTLETQTWLSASIRFRPLKQVGIAKGRASKRLDMAVEWAHRSENFLGQRASLFTDIATRYKVNEWLRSGMVYRHTFRDARRNDGNRFQFFAQTKREVGRFDVSYKIRYQLNLVDVDQERHVIRNRLGLEYRTKDFRINPVALAESFTWLHYSGNRYVGIRYTVGGNVNLPNGQEIDFGLKHDREIGVYSPTYRTIFALSYSYEL